MIRARCWPTAAMIRASTWRALRRRKIWICIACLKKLVSSYFFSLLQRCILGFSFFDLIAIVFNWKNTLLNLGYNTNLVWHVLNKGCPSWICDLFLHSLYRLWSNKRVRQVLFSIYDNNECIVPGILSLSNSTFISFLNMTYKSGAETCLLNDDKYAAVTQNRAKTSFNETMY